MVPPDVLNMHYTGWLFSMLVYNVSHILQIERFFEHQKHMSKILRPLMVGLVETKKRGELKLCILFILNIQVSEL